MSVRSIVLGSLAALAADAAQADVKIEAVQEYPGMCEASGGVALPEGSFGERFLVVDNEDNVLRVYAVGQPDQPPVTREVGAHLGLDPGEGGNDIDLEAATWLDGEVVLIGSHGRNESGKPRPARQKILTVAIDVNGTVEIGLPSGHSDALLLALAELGDDDLTAAIGDIDDPDEQLAPKKDGLNLEGMSVSADGDALFLGFRNPVPDEKALLVKLLNPKAVLFDGANPELEPPIRLDLGGRGIRSMEYSPAARAYFIIAGPVDDEAPFDIYQWSEGEAPERIPGAEEALASLDGFAPEGLIVDQTGTRLHLLSDNNNCTDKSFRSAVLRIE